MTSLATQTSGISCPRNRRISLLQRIGTLLSLRIQRQALADLDDHLLKDIGVDRHQAQAEARKSIWDVPAHWRS